MWSLRSEVFRRPWFRPEPFSFLAEREKEMDAIVVATKAKKRSEQRRGPPCRLLLYLTKSRQPSCNAARIQEAVFSDRGLNCITVASETRDSLRNGVIDIHVSTGDILCCESKATPLWSKRIPYGCCTGFSWTRGRNTIESPSDFRPTTLRGRFVLARAAQSSDAWPSGATKKRSG